MVVKTGQYTTPGQVRSNRSADGAATTATLSTGKHYPRRAGGKIRPKSGCPAFPSAFLGRKVRLDGPPQYDGEPKLLMAMFLTGIVVIALTVIAMSVATHT